MNPRIEAIITAQNRSKPAFADVVKDANAAASSIEGAGRRANVALQGQSRALTTVARSSAMAANQQRNLVFQLNDIGVSLAGGANPLMVLAQQGSQIATIYGPEEGGIGRALAVTTRMLGPFAAAAAAAATVVAGLTNEINKTASTSVSMGDVAMGAMQLAGESIMRELQPAFTWLAGVWDQISPYIKDGVNFLIGSFVLGYKDIKTYWSMLPAALGDVTIQTANNVVSGVEQMINSSLLQINAFILNAKAALAGTPFAGLTGMLSPIAGADFGELANPFAGAGAGMQEQLGQNRMEVFGTDFVGEIGKRAEAIALLGQTTDAAAGSTGRLASSYDALKNDGVGALLKKAQELTDTIAGGLTDGVMSLWKAFRSGENVLDVLGGKLLDFGDQLLSAGIQGLLQGVLGGGLGGGTWDKFGGFSGRSGMFGLPGVGSFDGGGYTGAGVRSGGIDGKGGFPAILHPNETVIDHTRAANSNGGALQVTVIAEVINGNLVPTMARVAGEVAGQKVNQMAPLAVRRAQMDRR